MNPSEPITGFQDLLTSYFKPEDRIRDPAVLETYSKDQDQVSEESPHLVVFPKSLEQVQELVRLAKAHKTPLVPVSSGPPRFRGDTVPERGGVMVDFSRMNRIRKIDPVSRCVMVESGVTYGDLVPELNKQGLRMNLPFLVRASKSVVTSGLEREPRLIPKYQYDDMDPLLTLEVVYGTGDDFRTGSASGPGTLETLKADKVNPWGPGAVDFFRFVSGAQGTMGLVTWAILKTEVLPSLQKLYFIPAENVKTLSTCMNQLLRKRIPDECLILDDVNLATLLAEDGSDGFHEIKKGLPSWTLLVCAAGYQRRPEERVHIQETHLLDICKDFGLKPQTSLTGIQNSGEKVLTLLSNPWTRKTYWKLSRMKACRDIFFLVPLSRVPEFIDLMEKILSKYTHPTDGVGCYIQPTAQGRGCHCEFNLFYDPSDTQETETIRNLFIEASETLMKHGAFFSRPYGPWADMVYDQYPEGIAALNKLKNIFDPANIFNPGKLCF